MKSIIVAVALLGLLGASTALAIEPVSTAKIENVAWRRGFYGSYGYGYRPYRWGGYYRPYGSYYGYGYGYRPYSAYYGGWGGGWGGGFYPYGGPYVGFGVY